MFGDFLQSIDLIEKLKDKRILEYIEADKVGDRRLQLKLGQQVGALTDAIRILKAAWDFEETKFSEARGQ